MFRTLIVVLGFTSLFMYAPAQAAPTPCKIDAHCASDSRCDMATGTCVPRKPCSATSECEKGEFCSVCNHVCMYQSEYCGPGPSPFPCSTGLVCVASTGECCAPGKLGTDAMSPSSATGCRTTADAAPRSGPQPGVLAGLSFLFGLTLLGRSRLAARRARARSRGRDAAGWNPQGRASSFPRPFPHPCK